MVLLMDPAGSWVRHGPWVVRWFGVDQAKAQQARKKIDGLPMLAAGQDWCSRCDIRPLFVSLATNLSWIALLVDCGTIGLEIVVRAKL
jgi:hypothetical protein